MSESAPDAQAAPKRRLLMLLPLVTFAALAAIFFVQLERGGDESVIPSALIGKPAPETSLPPLEATGLPGFDTAALSGKVALVNVWASWCVPCRQEHPLLMELSRDDRFVLAGFNYKDKPDNAARFLGSLGNPFAMIGRDESGRAAINWGVYGVPETFVVDTRGTIAFKHVGPLTPDSIASQIMPAIQKALAEAGSP